MMTEKQQLAEQILSHCRKKIHEKFQFLSQALYALKDQNDVEIESIGTDGNYLYYNPDYIITSFKKNPKDIYLATVHILLHCLLRHFAKKKFTNYPLYDVTTDIAVYFMMYNLSIIPLKSLNYVLDLIPQLNDFYGKHKVISWDVLYSTALNEPLLANDLLKNHNLFKVDDHLYWAFEKKDTSTLTGGIKKQGHSDEMWQTLKKQLLSLLSDPNIFDSNDFSSANKRSNFIGSLSLGQKNKSTFSYQEYLRKFARLEEIYKIDYDSYDPLWYMTGMDLYGDCPIIEYNEYKEDYVVNEFVLAIDTSGSCSGKIMEEFLVQTKKIFDDMKIANRQVNVKIIQCDDRIVQETDINRYEDVLEYTDDYKAYGFGGTSFVPVFNRITELQNEGQLKQLKGLIYLSDGYGTFPDSPSEYETIFVLPDKDMDEGLPDWVTRLVLDE